MAELILKIIAEGLVIVNKVLPDEASRINNQVLEYRRAWDAEMAKMDKRDDARLDELDRELRDIGELFLAAIKSAASKN